MGVVSEEDGASYFNHSMSVHFVLNIMLLSKISLGKESYYLNCLLNN